MLTDGGIETRVLFEARVALDAHVGVAALLDDPPGRAALRAMYAGYIDAARAYDLPVVLGTPTFRASPRFVRAAGLPDDAVRRLNAEAVAFHRELRTASAHVPVFIAGVIGPGGDAYTPTDCPGTRDAEVYHRLQAEALARAGVDLLFAPTFPAVAEALGAARTLGATGLAYV